MGRRPPPRKQRGPLGKLKELAAEANQLAAAANTPTVETDTWGYPTYRSAPRVESRPIPTVGFGHDPKVGSRPRKAARAAAAAKKNIKSSKGGTVRRV